MMGYIYFIIDGGKVVYIGKSINPKNRIEFHLGGKFTFDDVRVIGCDVSKMEHYERRWIALFRPRMNNHFNPDREKYFNGQNQQFRLRGPGDRKSINDFPSVLRLRGSLTCRPCKYRWISFKKETIKS